MITKEFLVARASRPLCGASFEDEMPKLGETPWAHEALLGSSEFANVKKRRSKPKTRLESIRITNKPTKSFIVKDLSLKSHYLIEN